MRTLLVDPVGGIAGDMLLAALADAGAEPARVVEAIDSLGLDGSSLTFEEERRRGLRGLRAVVTAGETPATARGLADCLAIVGGGALTAGARARAEKIFRRLAEAEAEVHGVALARVHFHEVGAIDSIVDIAGIAAALDLLEIGEIRTGPVPIGSGTIHSEHGEIPLPAPATAELLRGFEIRVTGRPFEHTTPTGAAVLAALGAPGLPETGRLGAVGVGFGSRASAGGPPNLTRVLVLEPGSEIGVVDVVEATIDDMTPVEAGYLVERLGAGGARDVFVIGAQMKKQRPGLLVVALADPGAADAIAEIFFLHSPTIGVRIRREARRELTRRVETVATSHGEIRLKIAVRPDGTERAMPEFEDCRRVALAAGVPIAEVTREADARWRDQSGRS